VEAPAVEPLLTPAEFAEVTHTTERLCRRLIAERRIRFVKIGKYVRIPQSALDEFLAAGTVEPATSGGAQAPAERSVTQRLPDRPENRSPLAAGTYGPRQVAVTR
jgi:excisionase family DNA binding protein